MFNPMFVPPRHNPGMIRLANLTLPLLAHFMGNIRDVQIPDEEFAHLEALRDERAILTPNHPTGNDPFVPFFLSRKLRQPFHYLAAREILVGFKGWVMNQVGAYSVIRGIADRPSLRATRALLAEQDRKVVIFPEVAPARHRERPAGPGACPEASDRAQGDLLPAPPPHRRTRAAGARARPWD